MATSSLANPAGNALQSARSVARWPVWVLLTAIVLHAFVALLMLADLQWRGTWIQYTILALVAAEFGFLLIAVRDFPQYSIALVPVIAIKLAGVVSLPVLGIVGWMDWLTAIGGTIFDAIWAVTLFLILRESFRPIGPAVSVLTPQDALQSARDQSGASLAELSSDRPTLVVCLRHFGCTFCREALADLALQRQKIEAQGAQIALVHMSPDEEAAHMLGRYGLSDIHRISDPLRRLYRALELRRGTWSQLFGWIVWKRGFRSALIDKHGLGKLMGDGFQMPGVFLIYNGEVLREYRHRTAADRPDYIRLADCDNCPQT